MTESILKTARRRDILKAVGAGTIATGVAGCTGDENGPNGADEDPGDDTGGESGDDTNGEPNNEVEPVEITLAEFSSPEAVYRELSIVPFIEEVERLSNGQMTFEVFAGGEMGGLGEVLNLLVDGVADMAQIANYAEDEELPLNGIGALPGVPVDPEVHALAFNELRHGLLYELEYEPLGIEPILNPPVLPNELNTTETQIMVPEDLNGMVMTALNANLEEAIRQLGGDTTWVDPPELAEALSRGTVDGSTYPNSSIYSWGLDEPLNYTTSNFPGGYSYGSYDMNADFYNSLTEQQRSILHEAADNIWDEISEGWATLEETEIEKMEEDGINVYELDDINMWEEELEPVREWWAGQVDNGEEVLEEFDEAIQDLE